MNQCVYVCVYYGACVLGAKVEEFELFLQPIPTVYIYPDPVLACGGGGARWQ